MIRNVALWFVSLYFKSITFLKCIVARFSGGSIKIGKGSTIHPSVILSTGGGMIVIGENCTLLKGVVLASYGGSISLGNNVSINPYSVLYGHGGLKIGNDVRIATHSVFIPAEHVFDDKDTPICKQGLRMGGISVGNDVWIAAGARILDTAEIADGCVIAANAVIKGATSPYVVYGGIPAKKLKDRG